jgi:hypothetical protein
MGMAVDQLQRRAEKAERDLAKFHECDRSNGCYDDCGRVHGLHGWDYAGMEVMDGNVAMLTVWHKEEKR